MRAVAGWLAGWLASEGAAARSCRLHGGAEPSCGRCNGCAGPRPTFLCFLLLWSSSSSERSCLLGRGNDDATHGQFNMGTV